MALVAVNGIQWARKWARKLARKLARKREELARSLRQALVLRLKYSILGEILFGSLLAKLTVLVYFGYYLTKPVSCAD